MNDIASTEIPMDRFEESKPPEEDERPEQRPERAWHLSADQKNLGVNLFCLALIAVGYALGNPLGPHVLNMGVFGFSGAATNWLAVTMLFERIPGIYGSGIIPLKFEAFKQAIFNLVMDQLFSEENLARFAPPQEARIHALGPVIDNLDMNPIFDGLMDQIAQSRLGGMMQMLGGEKLLEPMRVPFRRIVREKLHVLIKTPQFRKALAQQFPSLSDDAFRGKVEAVVHQRLDELTPEMVKQIVQKMIRSHLSWLVIWGGIFGCLIGLAVSLLGL